MAAGDLGRAIRDRRRALGFSQARLADSIGMSRAHLTRIEGGRWVPRLVTLNRLAAALGVTAASLLPTSNGRRVRRTASAARNLT